MSRIAASIFAAALLVSTGGLAETQTRESAETPSLCASYQAHADYLAARYREFPAFTGQIAEGLVLRLFANGHSGSWTMLVVRADGMACVQASGEGGQREAGI